MTERSIIFDPAILYNLYYRVNRNTVPQTIIFSGLTNINTKTWQLNFYNNESDVGVVTPVLQALAGSGLTLSTDRIVINLTAAQTNIAPRYYYYQLLNVTDNQTWINGRAYFHRGEFDNNGAAGADTITINVAGITEAPIDGQQYARFNGTWAVVAGGGGGVPTSRTLTINGTTFDLTANRTWTVGDVLISGTNTQPGSGVVNTSIQLNTNAASSIDISKAGTTGLFVGGDGTANVYAPQINFYATESTSQLIVLDDKGAPTGIQYNAAGYVTTDRSLTDRGYVLGLGGGTFWSSASGATLSAANTISGAFNIGFTNSKVGFGVAPASITSDTKVQIVGDGTSTSTFALRVTSLALSNIISARDDGEVYLGNNSITVSGNVIYRGVSTSSFLQLAGDSAGGGGSSVVMYGSTHATLPNVIEMYTAGAASQTIRADGKTVFVAATTSRASINLPHGSAPTSPVNGDIWTTTAGLYVRINGSTVGPLT
jgi:hypothetical protein